MNSKIIQLAAAIGMVLPGLPLLGDDCAGTRTSEIRYYTSGVRSSDVVTRTYVRTTPLYTDLQMSPVTTRTVLVRPESNVRYVDVGDAGTRSVLRFEDNERLPGGGDLPLDCGAAGTRSLSSVLLGLTSALEAARKIRELLEPDPPQAPPASVDEEELLKRLEPKIKQMVDKALDERGIPRKPATDSSADFEPFGNDRLPALQSAIVDESATIKEIKQELATAKAEREKIFQALEEIKNRLPKQ